MVRYVKILSQKTKTCIKKYFSKKQHLTKHISKNKMIGFTYEAIIKGLLVTMTVHHIVVCNLELKRGKKQFAFKIGF